MNASQQQFTDLYDKFGIKIGIMKPIESLIPNQTLNELGPGVITRIAEPAVISGGTFVSTEVMLAEERINAFFRRFLFKGSNVDGLTAAAGGGTITRNLIVTLLTSTGGNDCTLNSIRGHPISGNGFGAATHDFEFVCNVELVATAGQDVFWGIQDNGAVVLPVNSALTAAHAGFIVEDGTLKASSADGATQEITTITGVTLTGGFTTYKVINDATKDENKFYINDVLVATHRTYVIGGAGTHEPSILFGINNVVGADKTMYVCNNCLLIQ